MSNNTMVSRVENDRVLVLERVFDAPRDLVFSMFKEPEHLKHWWGPRGWEIPKMHCRLPSGRRLALLYEVCQSELGAIFWYGIMGKSSL